MPARTAACRRRFRRTKWSAWSPVPPPSTGDIVTAAGGAMQGRSRPPPRSFEPPQGRPRLKARATCGSLLLHLQRVFDGVESRKLHIVELAVDLLHFADIDVLHDVPRVRINGNLAARAFPFHALHRVDQGIAVGLALGLLER